MDIIHVPPWQQVDRGIPGPPDKVLCNSSYHFQACCRGCPIPGGLFLLIGAPVVLQSDNGSEFTASVITELQGLWPDLKLVHGKPRHPQSQG